MQTSELVGEKFGVTLILSECAFTAELSRDSISEMLHEIDSQLTEQGAPEDSATRIEAIMDKVSMIGHMVANDEVDHTDGMADIAYSMIYAFGKSIGFDQVITLRGLTGTMMRNVLSLNPCLGELEYRAETAFLQQVMEDHSDGDSFQTVPPARTWH